MKDLEVSLGPETGALTIRIGIHSGPVTAGVLRGEGSRFQLFGDTMNMTARMESTGEPNQIQISKETADLLKSHGKGHWFHRRSTPVTLKGKGVVETFWLDRPLNTSNGSLPGSREKEAPNEIPEDESTRKTNRLINWQVDVFTKLLQQIISHRQAKSLHSNTIRTKNRKEESLHNFELEPGKTCLDEVKDIIELPEFDPKAPVNANEEISHIVLSDGVRQQLHDYISAVAQMYRPNAFHNFNHACHVAMSVVKLLSRIVRPSDLFDDNTKGVGNMAATLHDHTYGITSDPLTQFAVVFSALIHDVDHTGVPNKQLVKEKPELAAIFRQQSVAEQNSIVLSLNLLMDEAYVDLRNVICANPEETMRFRQLVMQTVLATDIADRELKLLRNARWEVAFSSEPGTSSKQQEESRNRVNRKATIVIEHLIQASDVAHTMQHWHIYRRWNEYFFRESYQAYIEGRGEKDPSLDWYMGELGFFDLYIIPLAKKLKECGVFGKSSDEYLNYARANRQEWEERGQAVVAEMLQAVRQEQELQAAKAAPSLITEEEFEEEPSETL